MKGTTRFYLHRVPFVIVHAQYDLDIFRRLLFTAVKLSLQQGDVKVVPHVSWKTRMNYKFRRPVKMSIKQTSARLAPPGRMISGKPIFLTMAVLRSTKWGKSFLTCARSPGRSFRVTNRPGGKTARGNSKRWTQVVDGSKQRGQSRGANRQGARWLLTLAFVLDLLRGDDFVEDGGERLVFSNDSGWDERGHDELPLTDVGFHGDPGREVMGGWTRWTGQTEVFIHTLIMSRT